MKHCDQCERETHSAHDMTPTGAVVEMCAVCSHKRPAAKPEPVKPGLAKATPIEPVKAAAVALVGTSDCDDIVAHLRARLAVVDVELERAAGLRAERTKLRRMLAAAERRR